jgi:hypothetical protein
MLKKYLIKLLLRWYVGKYRDIHRVSTAKEIDLYKMRNSADIDELLRSEISKRVTKYFEINNELERNVIKGEVLALKTLKDKHLVAKRLDEEQSQDLKEKYWNKI